MKNIITTFILIQFCLSVHSQINIKIYDADSSGVAKNYRPPLVEEYTIGKIKFIVYQKKMLICIKTKFEQMPWNVKWYKITNIDHNNLEVIYTVTSGTGSEEIIIVSKKREYYKFPTSHGWCLEYEGEGLLIKFKGK